MCWGVSIFGPFKEYYVCIGGEYNECLPWNKRTIKFVGTDQTFNDNILGDYVPFKK